MKREIDLERSSDAGGDRSIEMMFVLLSKTRNEIEM